MAASGSAKIVYWTYTTNVILQLVDVVAWLHPPLLWPQAQRARGADVRAQPKRPASATAVGVLDVPGRAVASRRWQWGNASAHEDGARRGMQLRHVPWRHHCLVRVERVWARYPHDQDASHLLFPWSLHCRHGLCLRTFCRWAQNTLSSWSIKNWVFRNLPNYIWGSNLVLYKLCTGAWSPTSSRFFDMHFTPGRILFTSRCLVFPDEISGLLSILLQCLTLYCVCCILLANCNRFLCYHSIISFTIILL